MTIWWNRCLMKWQCTKASSKSLTSLFTHL
jgi:hypothetical protein